MKLNSKLYDGTSAYKIDEYYSYSREAEEKQREKKQNNIKKVSINRKKILLSIAVVFAVAISFLYANAVLIESATQVNTLNTKLEDLKVRNTQMSFDISSGVDLTKVEEKAINEFGMQHPESYQNVYVNVIQSDYSEVPGMDGKKIGLIDKMISELKSFLSYIS